MLSFTICFIKQGSKILMLNREKPVWMGIWNGIGGKIEKGETPSEGILREIIEETGIELEVENVNFKGIVSWTDPDNTYYDGMYVFTVELPEGFYYHTPIKTDEGILDWKEVTWVIDPENSGIADLKYHLAVVLDDPNQYEHKLTYDKGKVVQFNSISMGKEIVI